MKQTVELDEKDIKEAISYWLLYTRGLEAKGSVCLSTIQNYFKASVVVDSRCCVDVKLDPRWEDPECPPEELNR